jgi:hypothetical protein
MTTAITEHKSENDYTVIKKTAKILFLSLSDFTHRINCSTDIMLGTETAKGYNFPESNNTLQNLKNARLVSLPLDLDIPMDLQNLWPS